MSEQRIDKQIKIHADRLNNMALTKWVATNEELGAFYKKEFGRERMPGERSVPIEVFDAELKKEKRPHKTTKNSVLKDKVNNSSHGVRLLKAGKGLLETFEESTGISIPRENEND